MSPNPPRSDLPDAALAPSVQQEVARLAASPEVRSAFNWFRTQEANTNLSQIFNGPISDLILTTDSGGIAGGGGVIKQGAGAAYLNAANTYTLGTTNLAGLLAGSGSVRSPLADRK